MSSPLAGCRMEPPAGAHLPSGPTPAPVHLIPQNACGYIFVTGLAEENFFEAL